MFKEEIKEVEEAIDLSSEGLGCVILYNDDWHSFDEVIFQLVLAIECTEKKAQRLAEEVHTTGKSRVFDGQLEDCLGVSAILEDIALKTEIIH